MAPTERVLPHEIHYQDTGYFCGPAATRTALSVRGVVVAESTLAGILKTTTAGTNSSNDIVRGLNAYLPGIYSAKFIPGSSASAAQAEQFRRDLVHSVAAGYAVVANVVGTARASDGRNYSYPGGHYVSVVGYRKDGAEAYVSDNAVGRDYWMTTAVLATWIAGRGYAWAAGARAASSPKGRGRRVGAVVQHGHVYYFAPGYVKHLANPAEAMEMVNAETKEIHQTDAAGLQRVIWGYGLEEFSVADVEKLAKKPGGFLTASWLRGDGKTDVSALASKVDALAKQISDVAKSVADLAKRPAGEVDVAAIARAVNDDAARRLAE